MNSKLENLIKESKILGLDFDHHNHQVLINAVNSIKEVDGIVCEIGLRRGGGLALMMMTCINNQDTKRPFIAVDPYGNIPYKFKDGITVRLDYTNSMKCETLSNLYSFCKNENLSFDFFNMTDFDFFEKFSNGILSYNEERYLISEYALVHLDGPHQTEELIFEVNFFKKRMALGGIIVLDDVTAYYNLSKVENAILKEENFCLIENDGFKASYKRIK
jgi:hypothetical protein